MARDWLEVFTLLREWGWGMGPCLSNFLLAPESAAPRLDSLLSQIRGRRGGGGKGTFNKHC